MINNDTWIMRDLCDTKVAQGRGLAQRPKKLASLGIKRLMGRAIWAQCLRKKLETEKKRHPFSANHSCRTWFKTRCEQAGMKLSYAFINTSTKAACITDHAFLSIIKNFFHTYYVFVRIIRR